MNISGDETKILVNAYWFGDWVKQLAHGMLANYVSTRMKNTGHDDKLPPF